MTSLNKVKAVSWAFRNKKPLKCPFIGGFGFYVDLTGVSAECRFILQWMLEENLGTQAGVHLIEGVHLI